MSQQCQGYKINDGDDVGAKWDGEEADRAINMRLKTGACQDGSKAGEHAEQTHVGTRDMK